MKQLVFQNRFTDAEPVEADMVAGELARQLSRTAASFNTMLGKVGDLTTNNVITNEAGQLELMKIENSREIELLKIKNSENKFQGSN